MMKKEKVSSDFLCLAKELLSEPEKNNFVKIANKIESMRKHEEPTSDEDIFLAIVRDMSLSIGKRNKSKLRSLAAELIAEFGK